MISRRIYIIGMLLIRISRIRARKRANQSTNPDDQNQEQAEFAIAITTFSKRFFTYCLPLVIELRKSGITNPIYVAINGDLQNKHDVILRNKFLRELSLLHDVNPICFGDFQGLSRIWNRCVQSTREDCVVILNDDLVVNRDSLKVTLNQLVHQANISGACLLNQSWSHFAITKSTLSAVGWFDERFLGIGEEDGDYTFRFEEHYGVTIPSIFQSGFINDSSIDGDDTLAKGKGKYSLFNWVFLEQKYSFGEGRNSRMFEKKVTRVIDEIDFYPSYKWEGNLKHLLSEEDRAVVVAALVKESNEL